MNLPCHLPGFYLLLGATLFATGAQADPALPVASASVVYLTGQVHQQGPLPLPAGQVVTVHKAIILDGGLEEYADRLHIKLTRTNADGTNQVIMVNLAAITDRNHRDTDPVVKPGDVIEVPMVPTSADALK